MTVVVSWTRKTKTGRELWIMSDSRLSGGKFWDYGPKIFSMGRSDAIVGFAGDTAWTYPLISQITSYVESFVNLRDRVVDFLDVRKKVVRVLNDSLNFVSDAADPSLEIPECSFIFAGYSVRKQDYIVNKIVFNANKKIFEIKAIKKIHGELFAIIGDKDPVSAIAGEVSRIEKKYDGKGFKLDMIPSEVFFDVLSSEKFHEIGGAPQISKIYPNMNQQHIPVYWPMNKPHDEQSIYLRGRELGDYEALDNPWVFDPASGRAYWHDFSPIKMQEKSKAAKQEKSPYI
ncbi:hypothetical protein [Alteromonas sp. a30]|uniref:hypothetical protein n=1 Tax=Alteromonas sp. a30 TaxID=2730917 RepID=UPI00228053CD|nr:hypothetical protein [Alteromonas sp. a30]MCY7297435.1 hypothetical protein [Alteromonas sp. a30]